MSGIDPDLEHWIDGRRRAGTSQAEIDSLLDTAKINLPAYKESFDDGSGWAAMLALRLCWTLNNYPVPAWARNHIETAITRYNTAENETLESALGMKPRKHTRAKRRRAMWQGFVYQWITARHDAYKALIDEHGAISDGLFEQVAEAVNAVAPPDLRIEKTTAKNMYYTMKKAIETSKK